MTKTRKTGSRVRSLKQFSFQSLRKSLQRLWRCYRRWRPFQVHTAATGKQRSPMELHNVGWTISAAIEADRSCLRGSKSVTRQSLAVRYDGARPRRQRQTSTTPHQKLNTAFHICYLFRIDLTDRKIIWASSSYQTALVCQVLTLDVLWFLSKCVEKIYIISNPPPARCPTGSSENFTFYRKNLCYSSIGFGMHTASYLKSIKILIKC